MLNRWWSNGCVQRQRWRMTRAGSSPTSGFARILQRMLKTDLLFLNLSPIELHFYLLLKHYKGTHQWSTVTLSNVREKWRNRCTKSRKDRKYKLGSSCHSWAMMATGRKEKGKVWPARTEVFSIWENRIPELVNEETLVKLGRGRCRRLCRKEYSGCFDVHVLWFDK